MSVPSKTKQVVSILAFDKDGRVLVGLRGDTGKWNLPGGHVESGEDIYAAAKRELKEETGLEASVFNRVGFCDVRAGLRVHTFTCHATGEPDLSKDPDKEMVATKWVSPKSFPKTILDNLHNEKDVSLQFLEVQESTLDLIWDEDDAGDREGRIRLLGKAEDLQKMGAMNRLYPFDPTKDRMDPETEKRVAQWQGHAKDRHRQQGFAHMEGPARARALHNLAGKTKVRMSDAGQREFLLHRGVSPEEHAGATTEAGIVNHDKYSSWSPRYEIASHFSDRYAAPGTRHTLSAWVPESAISMIPKQYGNISPKVQISGLSSMNKPSSVPIGENRYADEHEIMVAPNHRSKRADPEDVASMSNPTGVDSRINQRATRKFEDQLANWLVAKSLKKAESNLAGEGIEDAGALARDMLGFTPHAHSAFAAARFLTGKPELPVEVIRLALYDYDGDYRKAALQAYGLEVNDSNLKSIKAVMQIGRFDKAESNVQIKHIEPGIPESQETADAIRRAIDDGQAKHVDLGGKHSKGSMIAKDPKTGGIWLLKPGAGGPGPAAGVQEEYASQSRREAAFYKIAELWNLENSVPRADLLIMDGREVAAIRMLPFTFKGLERRREDDPNLPRHALAHYRDQGLLHKWAVLDFVLGNPDRHGDNLMIDEDDKTLGLIDHGSAFAGDHFDPAFDKYSFVPFYLRAWNPDSFNRVSPSEKLKRMPTVSNQIKQELRAWLDGLHADALQGTLERYGIDPQSSVKRLAKLKVMASRMAVDDAINRLWVTT